jgi:type IV secretory pathway VirB10-like protein
MSLDRPPLPQLSLGAWQLKERGIEVAAVRVWHEVKAQAVEVGRMAQELAGQVRDWLDRAAERVLDRLGPEQSEMALAGGRDGREEEPDLATRLREAWEAGQGREEVQEADAPDRERETPQDLAGRLRAAAAGIDPGTLADRAAELREGREAEERQAELDASREQELERQREIEREVDSIAERDRSRGHSL